MELPASRGRNPSSAYYTSSVKSVSKHNVAFGLYCSKQANGNFAYCGRISPHIVKPVGSCTSGTMTSDKYYKVKLVAGNDLVNNLQKGCIASLLSMIEAIRGKKLSPEEAGIKGNVDMEADSGTVEYRYAVSSAFVRA